MLETQILSRMVPENINKMKMMKQEYMEFIRQYLTKWRMEPLIDHILNNTGQTVGHY